MYVSKGGKSPWDSFNFVGQLQKDWAIDTTVAEIRGKKYFVWSCLRGGLQSLCAGDMISPTRVGNSHTISQPLLPWERHGDGKINNVNEGPELLVKDDKYFLIYSASFCATQFYVLGQLELTGSNPLDGKSWRKSGPIMKSANGNYGPGHNG